MNLELRRALVPAAMFLSLAVSGCGSGEESSSSPEKATPGAPAVHGDETADERATTEAPAPAPSAGAGGRSSSSDGVEELASEPYASESMGSIRGEVRFTGEAPERFKIVAEEKPECSMHPDVDHMSELVIVNGGKLQNVLVHVTRGYDAAKIPPPPAEPAHLDQRGCTYVPHVLAVQTGRTILVGNSDPTNHNVHITARKNDISSNHNVAQGQEPFTLVPNKEELSVRFKCDIHPWMGSWLHVIEHPWFAVSDASGAFEIKDLPPGKYTLEFVHEEYGKKTARDVVVEAGKSKVLAASFP